MRRRVAASDQHPHARPRHGAGGGPAGGLDRRATPRGRCRPSRPARLTRPARAPPPAGGARSAGGRGLELGPMQGLRPSRLPARRCAERIGLAGRRRHAHRVRLRATRRRANAAARLAARRLACMAACCGGADDRSSTSRARRRSPALLRLTGANRALLDFEAGRVARDVRNRLNRLLNAEEANVDRTVRAADRQLQAIAQLEANGELERLPDGPARDGCPAQPPAGRRPRHARIGARRQPLGGEPPTATPGGAGRRARGRRQAECRLRASRWWPATGR